MWGPPIRGRFRGALSTYGVAPEPRWCALGRIWGAPRVHGGALLVSIRQSRGSTLHLRTDCAQDGAECGISAWLGQAQGRQRAAPLSVERRRMLRPSGRDDVVKAPHEGGLGGAARWRPGWQPPHPGRGPSREGVCTNSTSSGAARGRGTHVQAVARPGRRERAEEGARR